MRAVSLLRFPQSRTVDPARALVLVLLLAVIVLLAFGATGVAATTIPITDPQPPFRWA